MARFAVRLLIAAAMAAAAAPGNAQTSATPAAPASADAAMEVEKTAFLALSEADRKLAQDALSWLGLYNGAVDGGFGKRTHDAIIAYQSSVKAPADGVLTGAQLTALKAAGQKAREAVGFQTIEDAKSGIRVGAPLKILVKRSPDGARLTKADGSATLELLTPPVAESDLAALYAKVSADAPERKIAYKAIKPDVFFVVTGEEAARKAASGVEQPARNFYTRYAKGGANQGLRGFTFSYPAAQASEYDRIALAIANSFEPFPTSQTSPMTAANPPANPPPTSAEPPKPAPSGPVLVATALAVAQGQALCAIRQEDCPNLVIGGKPAKITRADASSGLALIEGDFAAAAPIAEGALGRDLVVLSVVGGGDGKRPTLTASAAEAPGSEAQRAIVVAPLEKSASGAPVFDRDGALAGLIAPIGEEPRRFASVAIAAPHAVIGARAIKAFLGDGLSAAPPSAPMSAGEIAAAKRAAIHAVYCNR